MSIVIPCWNCATQIRGAINSVIAQTIGPSEIIVVDDGSTDNLGDALKPFGERVRYLYTPHLGASAARNAGLGAARGKYLKFLDADDYLDPDVLATEIKRLTSAPEKTLVVSGSVAIYADGVCRPHWGTHLAGLKEGDPIALPSCVECTPCVGGPLYDREALIDIGGFNEKLRIHEDDDVCIRYLLRGYRPIYSGIIGYYYRQRAAAVTKELRTMRENCTQELEMLKRHFALAKDVENDEERKGVVLATARRAWTSARALVREHALQEAQTLFEFAEEAGGREAVNGSRAYGCINRLFGPVTAEWAVARGKSVANALTKGQL